MRLNIQLKIHLPATRHHLNFKCRAKLENLVDILTRAHTRGRAQWRSFVKILRLAKSPKAKCVKNAQKQVNIMLGAPSLQFTLSHLFKIYPFIHYSWTPCLVFGNSLDQCDLCRLQMRWWPLHSCCWMVASEATTFINHNKILASKFGGNLHNEKLFYSLEIRTLMSSTVTARKHHTF